MCPEGQKEMTGLSLSGLLLVLSLVAQATMGFQISAPAASRRQAFTRLRMTAGPGRQAVSDVSVVLLAGGVGSRMKADRPKQFLDLLGKPVFLHSLDIFQTLPGVTRIVIVMDQSYRKDYAYLAEKDKRIVFADPGKERQDSVFNGFQKALPEASVVCIHDSARPLVSQSAVLEVLSDAAIHGAAVLGVPMKATVKESVDGRFVSRTIPRSRLWEIQTPQVIKPDILKEGFKRVKEEGIEVTDDVSIVEEIGLPVKITMGEYTNLKLTTPEDMNVAEEFLRQRAREQKVIEA